MYVQKNLMTDLEGNFTFTVRTNSEAHAREVTAEREETQGWTEERTMRKCLSVPPYLYQEFSDKLGAECWEDNDFLDWFTKHRPEFVV